MITKKRNQGFSLVELTVGIILVGLAMLTFSIIMNFMQKSSAQTTQFTDAQQNARIALDFVTSNLRSAGSSISAVEGQRTIVHASPYQVAFNADMDGGEVINGEAPVDAIEVAQSPNTVPSGGTTIYAPPQTYASGAETIVLTLDSNEDGSVDGADRGDEAEEDGNNDHLFVLKRYIYGFEKGGTNVIREASVSLVRGPVDYPDGSSPAPLFSYYYNHDDNLVTPDLLWGDSNGDGELDGGEVAALTAVPDSLTHAIRKVSVNVIAESMVQNPKHEYNDGFVQVVMNSEVYVRNADIGETARVFGVVFYDANKNGVRDNKETGIPKAVVKLTSASRSTVTNQYGEYSIPVGPGDHTVVETDPAGYTSSTSNTVAVSLAPGEMEEVNFGDISGLSYGYIRGVVYLDKNEDTKMGFDEDGIAGVTVSLSNDMATKTNKTGYYRLTVPVGSYTVTEHDLEGYGSSTPNDVDVTIAAQGDSVTVNFGDTPGDATGTLNGYVFEDIDEDGLRDFGEKGLSDIEIQLSNGYLQNTDSEGYYEFTLPPGKYDVYELDPEGYTSSTPNLVEDVAIAADSMTTVNFGDMLIKDLDFIEIVVGDTDRPLSISSVDLKEDLKVDTDIVLGTPSSGETGNVFIYENLYEDSSTELGNLFESSPTHIRKASSDVNTIVTFDITQDGFPDVLTGQEDPYGSNMLVWHNDLLGSIGTAPAQFYTTGYYSSVRKAKVVNVDNYWDRDMILGFKADWSPYTGGFEVYIGYAGYLYLSQQIYWWGPDYMLLGEVVSFDLGDLNGDGFNDLVVASNSGDTWGNIDIYLDAGGGYYYWAQRLLMKAGVNDVAVIDLGDNGSKRPDILVATTEAPYAGGVQVWLNNGNGTFGVHDQSGFEYQPNVQPRVPDRYFNAGGEVLAIRAQHLDADIYPEVLLGTRSSSFYTGDLLLIRNLGDSEPIYENLKVNLAGEVVAIDLADFNKDYAPDVLVTTRNSLNSGKLAIYFGDNSDLVALSK